MLLTNCSFYIKRQSLILSFNTCWVKPKTIKLVFVASLLSMQLQRVRAIEIMCLSGATCQPTDCWFIELAL